MVSRARIPSSPSEIAYRQRSIEPPMPITADFGSPPVTATFAFIASPALPAGGELDDLPCSSAVSHQSQGTVGPAARIINAASSNHYIERACEPAAASSLQTSSTDPVFALFCLELYLSQQTARRSTRSNTEQSYSPKAFVSYDEMATLPLFRILRLPNPQTRSKVEA